MISLNLLRRLLCLFCHLVTPGLPSHVVTPLNSFCLYVTITPCVSIIIWSFPLPMVMVYIPPHSLISIWSHLQKLWFQIRPHWLVPGIRFQHISGEDKIGLIVHRFLNKNVFPPLGSLLVSAQLEGADISEEILVKFKPENKSTFLQEQFPAQTVKGSMYHNEQIVMDVRENLLCSLCWTPGLL